MQTGPASVYADSNHDIGSIPLWQNSCPGAWTACLSDTVIMLNVDAEMGKIAFHA